MNTCGGPCGRISPCENWSAADVEGEGELSGRTATDEEDTDRAVGGSYGAGPDVESPTPPKVNGFFLGGGGVSEGCCHLRGVTEPDALVRK